MRTFPFALVALLTIAGPPHALAAQSGGGACTGTVYGKGKRAICLPQGAASFADSVVSFAPGARPSSGVWAEARHVLGEPDYTRTTAPGFLSLGCDGVLIVRFDDNALVDVAGPDLYVFEVGPAVEATELAVSVDGKTWLEVGRIEGARAELELSGIIDPDDAYRYVRLTNRSTTCGGRHSGADIDAIAAVGSALRVALDAAVLFDVGSSTLKSDAVRDALVAAGVQASILRTRGHGARRPVAPNDPPANKARNRRVDLLVR